MTVPFTSEAGEDGGRRRAAGRQEERPPCLPLWRRRAAAARRRRDRQALRREPPRCRNTAAKASELTQTAGCPKRSNRQRQTAARSERRCLRPPLTTIAPALTKADASVIIRRGDSLWRISRRIYGRGVRYSTIYLANKEKVTNPNRIWPGQVMTIPEKTTEGEAADMAEIEKRNKERRMQSNSACKIVIHRLSSINDEH